MPDCAAATPYRRMAASIASTRSATTDTASATAAASVVLPDPGRPQICTSTRVSAPSAPLQRVVAPVHQRVPPRRVRDVPGGPLRQVPVHVPHDLPHVGVVVVRQVGLPRARDLDDPPPGAVPDGLAAAVLLPDGPRLVRAEPVLELLRRHGDGVRVVPRDLGALLVVHARHAGTGPPRPRAAASRTTTLAGPLPRARSARVACAVTRPGPPGTGSDERGVPWPTAPRS